MMRSWRFGFNDKDNDNKQLLKFGLMIIINNNKWMLKMCINNNDDDEILEVWISDNNK